MLNCTPGIDWFEGDVVGAREYQPTAELLEQSLEESSGTAKDEQYFAVKKRLITGLTSTIVLVDGSLEAMLNRVASLEETSTASKESPKKSQGSTRAPTTKTVIMCHSDGLLIVKEMAGASTAATVKVGR